MYVCRTRKEFGGFFNISGKSNIKPAKDKRFRCISAKRSKNRQFTIWLMAPCNMRCKPYGEYIYKGKKFDARKEDVIGETYLTR